MEPTATMQPRTPTEPGLRSETHVINPPASPRERLQRGRPPRWKDVEIPERGRFRVRELKQREIEEANEPLVRRESVDGKVVSHFDNRGHRARLIAFALINDDGTNIYTDPMGEGALEIGNLTRAEVDLLWVPVDELNGFSKEAKDDLGKDSARTGSAGS